MNIGNMLFISIMISEVLAFIGSYIIWVDDGKPKGKLCETFTYMQIAPLLVVVVTSMSYFIMIITGG